jgi:hypothetical protein
MRFACWTPKTTNTRSEYATLTVFPQQLLFLCATLPVLLRFRVGVAEDSVLLGMTPRRWIIDSRRFETK